MESLDWKDMPEPYSWKVSAATPWFGATMFLIGVILGFAIGNFINI